MGYVPGCARPTLLLTLLSLITASLEDSSILTSLAACVVFFYIRIWPISAERGVKGFMQGVFSPLIGSSFYRMAMLSAYESSYTYFSAQDRDGFWHTQVADGWVPRPLVFASALCASLSRSVVESPFEYTKVMRQTDKPWKFNELYRGFGMQVSLRH
jgi:hypothetical protein